MIVRRTYYESREVWGRTIDGARIRQRTDIWHVDGWWLFGLLPLYVREKLADGKLP